MLNPHYYLWNNDFQADQLAAPICGKKTSVHSFNIIKYMCLNTDLLSIIWESTDWENFDAKYFELHSNKAYFLYDII